MLLRHTNNLTTDILVMHVAHGYRLRMLLNAAAHYTHNRQDPRSIHLAKRLNQLSARHLRGFGVQFSFTQLSELSRHLSVRAWQAGRAEPCRRSGCITRANLRLVHGEG